MADHRAGCLLCGKPLEYFCGEKTLACAICGNKHETNAACIDNHYICNACHSHHAFESITKRMLNSRSKDPIENTKRAMRDVFVKLHGPEHHYIVCSSLLSAYKNAGGVIDLPTLLGIAKERAKRVPPGICGLWGSCGAAISAGIFVSVITGATPLSDKEWVYANRITSECLKDIADNGGVRCCKRNSFLSVSRAVQFIKKNFSIEMSLPIAIRCNFSHMNNTCKKSECLYFSAK